MNNSLKKRMLSLFLAMVMVISLVPVTAFAADDEIIPETSEILLTGDEAGDGNDGETPVETTEETVVETTEATVVETTEETVVETTEETTVETTEETTVETTDEAAKETTLETTEETLPEIAGEINALAIEENKVIYENGKFGYNGYYNVISRKDYTLVPGAAIEYEMVLNNDAGNRRQVIHVIEVDPSNPDVSIVPGYHQIDKIAENPNNEAYWSHKELTDMAKYYEDNLGYNIVGGMNTDLYYDTYAPHVLVYNGQDLSVKGKTSPTSSILYVFKDAEGKVSCDVRAFNRNEFNGYLADGTLLHAVGVSFGMVVKDGQLVKKEERTSAAAARSMVGVKEDGTLVICMNDGRGANNSVGFCDFEEGEAMLALGCKWAANCDGGGSSTFLTQRAGEETFTMRSVPCDGAQRPTAHGIFVVSNVGPTGKLNNVNIESEYDIFAPKTEYTFGTKAIDTNGYAMDMPADAVWTLSDASFGTIANGKFTSNGTKGTVDVQILSNGEVVGTKTITVADPEVFSLSATSTVVPYSTAEKVRTIKLPIVAMTGEANVYVDTNAVSVALSNKAAGTLDGFNFTATEDTSIAGTDVTITYGEIVLTYAISFGKGSEVIYDFEDGKTAGFMGFEEAKKWSKNHSVNNTLVGAEPLAGQFNAYLSSTTAAVTADDGGQVRNGNYALKWTLDNSDAAFASWSYNVLFNTGDTIVLRDVANGMKATTLGMWLYIPENAFPSAGKGLAFQSQLYAKNADGSYSCKQDHFMFTSAATGKQTNLNSATNADIPESRWVYATIDISKYDYLCTPVASDEGNSRSPSFIRTYVKPETADIVTFYIDDITLDYSSAVDDRVLPTISAPTYSTSDTAVALENGTTINGNKLAFSATVADNAALDMSSGKIYVDGVAVNASIAGAVLSSKEDVTLGAGEHTVAFEVKDELGNPAKITRTFTVAGDAAVTLTGHNDSGETPKAQSVYYVDINVADLSKVGKLVAQLKLHNANTWETKGAVVADGFKASFDYNEISELLTVTVEAVDAAKAKSADKTLVSIPVRTWVYDRFNYVTETYEDPAELLQKNDKGAELVNKPAVNVACDVVYGTINGTPFGGSINVATELTTISSPYHLHDAELTVLNKEATTSEAGYENRTYCETCKSVVDWGTILDKVVITHNYAIVGDQFICQDEGCGKVYESGTGVFEMNGSLYYSINSILKKNWQSTDDGYCYASTGDYKLYIGEKTIGGVTYVFGENGSTKGAWTTNEKGTRYSYGPGFYTRMWQELDGKLYYFGRDKYLYTGINFVKDNPDTPPYWYDFGEDGAVEVVDGQKIRWDYEGLYTLGEDLYYIKDSTSQGGLQKIDGVFYYFDAGTYEAKKSCTYSISYTNGLTFDDGTPVPKGSYVFDADGKMIVKNGLVDGYYYVNGVKKPYAGLINQDGSFFYINDNAKPVAGKSYYITKTNDLTFSNGNPIPKGTYEFGEDGKMKIKEGLVDGIYYESGIKVPYAGLIKQDGYFYYINDNAKPVAGRSYYITKLNGLTYDNGTPVVKGSYEFDAEGRMIIREGLVDGIYYENNKAVPYKGLIKQDGYFYYINDNAKPVAGKSYYISRLNDLTYDDGTPVAKGTYEFDAEGRMVIKEGLVDGIYYEHNKAVPYKGLIKHEGDFYYVNDNGKVITSRTYYISRTNDLTLDDGTPIAKGKYEFDATGKMILN